jgi:hypothetical protein
MISPEMTQSRMGSAATHASQMCHRLYLPRPFMRQAYGVIGSATTFGPVALNQQLTMG